LLWALTIAPVCLIDGGVLCEGRKCLSRGTVNNTIGMCCTGHMTGRACQVTHKKLCMHVLGALSNYTHTL